MGVKIALQPEDPPIFQQSGCSTDEQLVKKNPQPPELMGCRGNKLILTTKPALVIQVALVCVQERGQYVGLSCPVVARRAITALSRRSFSEDGCGNQCSIHHFLFIRAEKAMSHPFYLFEKKKKTAKREGS